MIKVVPTNDGSNTLLHESLNETYHSSHGALTESIHVFIQNGLLRVFETEDEVHVLEVGLGTGLNAILTIEQAIKNPDKKITYFTLEPFPLNYALVQQLKYDQLISSELQPFFEQIHTVNWNEKVDILPNFTLFKVDQTLEDVDFTKNPEKFAVTYFDAFAPNKQPEVWSDSNIQKVYDFTESNGILVTYCAKGSFKRSLKAAGFDVQKLPGPPGKREMTLGTKP